MIDLARFRREPKALSRGSYRRREPSAFLSLAALSWVGYFVLAALTTGAASKTRIDAASTAIVDPGVATARMVTDIPARSWRGVIVNVYKSIDEDRVLAVAAGVAFYALLAIFPAVTTLVSLYGVFNDRTQVAADLASLAVILPDGAVSIISEQAMRIASGAPLSLGFTALFSFLLAIWSANSGMKALIDALNVSYAKRETRTLLRLHLTSFALTMGSLLFLLLMLGAALILTVNLSAAAAQAAELLMFSQGGCPSCQRWDREVGTIYDKTAEAKILPLRRIDIASQTASNVTLSSRVLYTPTFVVVNGGREIGRITGYINDAAFWGLLGTLAAKLTRSQTETDRI